MIYCPQKEDIGNIGIVRKQEHIAFIIADIQRLSSTSKLSCCPGTSARQRYTFEQSVSRRLSRSRYKLQLL